MSETQDTMRAVAAVATEFGRAALAGDLCAEVEKGLGGQRADLCVLFASAHFENELERIAAEIYERLRPRAFIGATGESVIHADVEYEHAPAVTLWAAHLPDVRVTSFHVSQQDLERLETPAELIDLLGAPPETNPSFVLLGDPFSINILQFMQVLEQNYPQRPAVGGMASAGEQPGQNWLIFDGQTLRQGLVGVSLFGNVQLDTVVSQGCKPIGRPLVITKAERNVIHQLGGKPAWTMLNDVMRECAPEDIQLARTHGLLIGRVINEQQATFGRGDFLIRNPIDVDAASGAVAVNDLVRTGQTIQFHVRDGASAAEDLTSLLSVAATTSAAGALLFSCNGRGTRLFDDRNHDAREIAARAGGAPLAGFFCAGEIGPIGNRNFLHGHTASIGFLRPLHG